MDVDGTVGDVTAEALSKRLALFLRAFHRLEMFSIFELVAAMGLSMASVLDARGRRFSTRSCRSSTSHPVKSSASATKAIVRPIRAARRFIPPFTTRKQSEKPMPPSL